MGGGGKELGASVTACDKVNISALTANTGVVERVI